MTLDFRYIPEYDLYSNIVTYYAGTDADSRARGMEWYSEAHTFASDLDSDIDRAAGIIAALSPMSPWANNKRKAAYLYSLGGKVKWNGTSNGIGLSNNVRKAIAIYEGVNPLSVITANKTRAFYLTIADPMGDHAPVIDRHAFDIAVGMRTDDDARKALARKGEYDRFATAYRSAARTIGIAPAQLQAITWVQWRKDIGKEWAG